VNIQADRGFDAFASPGSGPFSPVGQVAPIGRSDYALVATPDGRVVVAYTEGDYLYTATSRNGASFDAAQQVPGSERASFPRLVAGRNGDVFASWGTLVCDSGCPSKTMTRVAIEPAGSDAFEPAQQLLSADGLAGGPLQIVTDKRGAALAAWWSSPDGTWEEARLSFARRPPGGRFGPATTLYRPRGVMGFRLAGAPGGRAAIVWNRFGDAPIHVATGTVRGGFGRPRTLGGRHGRRARVALGGSGGIVAWIEGGHRRVVRIASLSGRRIGRPRTLARGPAFRLAALVDPRGRRVIAWRGLPIRSLHVAMANAGAAFHEQRLATRGTRYFSLRATSRGHVLVAWLKTPPNGAQVRWEPWHVRAAFAPPGRPFGKSIRLDRRSDGTGIPKLATGPAGRALVFWQQASKGADHDAALVRYFRP
jgi:hypothetical protein